MKKSILAVQISLAATILTGCQQPDERLARFASEATARQAEQNREMSQLNREVVDNHRRVIEAAARSRETVASLDRQIEQQRQRLDDERRSLVDERRRESLLVPVLTNTGILMVTALPLVLCWFLLHGLRSDSEESSDQLIQSLLMDEIGRLPQRNSNRSIEYATSSDDTDLPF